MKLLIKLRIKTEFKTCFYTDIYTDIFKSHIWFIKFLLTLVQSFSKHTACVSIHDKLSTFVTTRSHSFPSTTAILPRMTLHKHILYYIFFRIIIDSFKDISHIIIHEYIQHFTITIDSIITTNITFGLVIQFLSYLPQWVFPLFQWIPTFFHVAYASVQTHNTQAARNTWRFWRQVAGWTIIELTRGAGRWRASWNRGGRRVTTWLRLGPRGMLGAVNVDRNRT